MVPLSPSSPPLSLSLSLSTSLGTSGEKITPHRLFTSDPVTLGDDRIMTCQPSTYKWSIYIWWASANLSSVCSQQHPNTTSNTTSEHNILHVSTDKQTRPSPWSHGDVLPGRAALDTNVYGTIRVRAKSKRHRVSVYNGKYRVKSTYGRRRPRNLSIVPSSILASTTWSVDRSVDWSGK